MRCAFVLFALTVTACSTGRGSGDSPADPPATTTARASGNEIATIVTHDAKVRILGSHDGALRVAVYRTDGVLAYDGMNPLPPTFCYLKPHYLDVQTSYFDHAAAGRL